MSSSAVRARNTLELAKEAGARRAIVLPVSVPSHCALMSDAAEHLKGELENVEISTPSIPVIQNADVESFSDVAQIRDALVRQLFQPVQWTATIIRLVEAGVTDFYECGPGKVLAGLNRRINRESSITALTDLDTIAGSVSGE